jgi:hypothetical protein
MSHQPGTSLQLNAKQIEQIVRDVLASLTKHGDVQVSSAQSSAPPLSNPTTAVGNETTGSFHISAPVISLDVLRSMPMGTKQITVAQSVLITPAAKDFLKDKGISWTTAAAEAPKSSPALRAIEPSALDSTAVKNPTGSLSKRLFITGSVLWLRNLENQLCPKATVVDEVQIDDAAAIRSVAQAFGKGASHAVAIVKAPHATLWQAARDEALRPAIISQWSDLAEVFREVPTNLLIVPAMRWSIAGSANITRKFLEHLKANR